uniref:ERCC4 domain-containing protein n=1 Tax=viral metagenome TaxID=1070528 RepID=A0A6H1Z7Q1_9ZZZZ
MSFIVQDVYEPEYLAQMLSTFMRVQRDNLVQKGLLDFFWFAGDGHSITMERKEWSDLMANLPRLEKQLRTATNNADEVGLIVEGVAIPLAGGEVSLYHVGKNPKYLRQVKISGMQYSSIMAYIWQLRRTANITTYWTSTIQATVWTLKTFVENSQKLDSTLLQHYVRTRQIKWQSNPMVETIMALKDADGYVIGEKKAIELVEKIGNLWDIIHLVPEEIVFACDGIGIATARRLINAIKGIK